MLLKASKDRSASLKSNSTERLAQQQLHRARERVRATACLVHSAGSSPASRLIGQRIGRLPLRRRDYRENIVQCCRAHNQQSRMLFREGSSRLLTDQATNRQAPHQQRWSPPTPSPPSLPTQLASARASLLPSCVTVSYAAACKPSSSICNVQLCSNHRACEKLPPT